MGLVSVVIPCRNEEKYIKQCISSVLDSDYPEIEVLVVDGMSEDATREIVQGICERDERVQLIDNVKQLTPYAFNLGIENSVGEYIQIVGARNVIASDYISILKEKLDSSDDIACVGGDIQHASDTKQSHFISEAMTSKFGVGGGNFRTMEKDCYVDTVGIPMYKRAIFDEFGLFDESLTRNQDDDFNFRLTKEKYKICYVFRAKTKYFVRGTYGKLYRQMSQYGYFKVFVNKKHGTITTLRQIIPPLFLIFLLTFGTASFVSNFALLTLVLILSIYCLAGHLSVRRSGFKFQDRLMVQWVIFTMHIGYGFGYLKGVWDFLVLNRIPNTAMQKQTL